jgi:hypothetical protein
VSWAWRRDQRCWASGRGFEEGEGKRVVKWVREREVRVVWTVGEDDVAEGGFAETEAAGGKAETIFSTTLDPNPFNRLSSIESNHSWTLSWAPPSFLSSQERAETGRSAEVWSAGLCSEARSFESSLEGEIPAEEVKPIWERIWERMWKAKWEATR